MTTKQEVLQLVERLPEESSLEDILAELYFKLRVDHAMREVDAGRVVSDAEARERFARWLKSPVNQPA